MAIGRRACGIQETARQLGAVIRTEIYQPEVVNPIETRLGEEKF